MNPIPPQSSIRSSSRPGSGRDVCRSGPLHGIRLASVLVAIFVAGVVSGCDSGFPSSGPERTISDEAFVETIVELRRAAAREGEGGLTPARRDEILANRGVTEEQLFRFVEVHGRNVPRMTAVWTEVEARLTGQDPEDLELDEDDFDTIPGLTDPDRMDPDMADPEMMDPATAGPDAPSEDLPGEIGPRS